MARFNYGAAEMFSYAEHGHAASFEPDSENRSRKKRSLQEGILRPAILILMNDTNQRQKSPIAISLGGSAFVYSRQGSLSSPSVFIFLLTVIAVVVLLFMLKDFWQRKEDTAIVTSPYQLSALYTKDDFVEILAEMEKEPSFQIYFDTLTPNNMNAAMKEVFEFLDKNRGEKLLKDEVLRRQSNIEGMALSFNGLSYPEDFFQAPGEHEELGQALWLFVFEEFKATVFALLYKDNYKNGFTFNWKNKESLKETSEKVRNILQKLSPEQKRALGEAFVSP